MRFLRILKSRLRTGRCRYCRQRIAWATSDQGKYLPLELTAEPLRTETDVATRLVFEVYALSALHFTTCPAPRPRRTGRSS